MLRGRGMDFEYRAFISYSHRDARWAEWLLHALETYRLPDSKVRGVGRVFRDRDEAGAGDLRDEIQRALAASENLIVIASPNSARSLYVQAEIESFVAHHAARDVRGSIVTLIVDGEPNVSRDAIDPRECFPPALRGGIRLADGTNFEPLAADARSVGDGRTRALAKVVAGLMDIRYDALVRRDLLRRRRTRMIAGGAALATLLTAGAVWQTSTCASPPRAPVRPTYPHHPPVAAWEPGRRATKGMARPYPLRAKHPSTIASLRLSPSLSTTNRAVTGSW